MERISTPTRAASRTCRSTKLGPADSVTSTPTSPPETTVASNAVVDPEVTRMPADPAPEISHPDTDPAEPSSTCTPYPPERCTDSRRTSGAACATSTRPCPAASTTTQSSTTGVEPVATRNPAPFTRSTVTRRSTGELLPSTATAGLPVPVMRQSSNTPSAWSAASTALASTSLNVHCSNRGLPPDRITTAEAWIRSNEQPVNVPPAPSTTITPAPTALANVQPLARTSPVWYAHNAAADSASRTHSSSRSRPAGTSTAAVSAPWCTSTTPDNDADSPASLTTGPPAASTRTSPGAPAADNVTSRSSTSDSRYVPGWIEITPPATDAAIASPIVR